MLWILQSFPQTKDNNTSCQINSKPSQSNSLSSIYNSFPGLIHALVHYMQIPLLSVVVLYPSFCSSIPYIEELPRKIFPQIGNREGEVLVAGGISKRAKRGGLCDEMLFPIVCRLAGSQICCCYCYCNEAERQIALAGYRVVS